MLLSIGGIGLSAQSTRLREPTAPLQAFDPVGYSIMAAVADRIVPNGADYPSASDVGVAEKIDALLATMHPGVGEELQEALKLLENATVGLLLDGRTTPFTASSHDVQDDTLHSWQHSKPHSNLHSKVHIPWASLCRIVERFDIELFSDFSAK